jgi:hypothetical protein
MNVGWFSGNMVVWMAPFLPGKGDGKGVAYGRKDKGVLIHNLTDGAGMLLSMRTMPANGDERAQVIPLLDALHIRTGKRGRPRKRLKVLATDKGYDAKNFRHHLRTRGIQPKISKRVWKSRKPRGEADQPGCPWLPSRADICLVPTEVPSMGRALGTDRRLL